VAQIGIPSYYDTYGVLGRHLTHMLSRYRLNNPNEDVRVTPDGLLLMFEGLAFGAEYQILIAKMPSFPSSIDSQNRSPFLPVKLTLSPPSGLGITNAIGLFGYAENGDPASYYCT